MKGGKTGACLKRRLTAWIRARKAFCPTCGNRACVINVIQRGVKLG